jgi:hypothetical protein
MACKCTEDYTYEGNVRIGRNRVMCQECLDAQIISQKNRELQQKQAEIQALELANLRKLYDKEDLTAVNEQRLSLRSDIGVLVSDIDLAKTVMLEATKSTEIVKEL